MIPHTFDTSFINARKPYSYLDNYYFSDPVLLELIGYSGDEGIADRLRRLRGLYARDGFLITPAPGDWEMAGKILFWLEHNVRKNHKGKAQPKITGATQRMALDVLIATSARRHGVTVVTENYKDFDAIRYFCDFKLMSGADFLEKFEDKIKR